MSTEKLTQTYINTLPIKDKAYWINDASLPALRLFVGKSGIKTYYVTYKNHKGKKDSYKLGDERLFTPSQARDAAKKILADMAVSGIDIKQERKRIDKITLRQIRDAYRLAGRSNVALNDTLCFETFFDIPVEEITQLDIEKWRTAAKINYNLTNATLNKKTTCLKAILNFALDNGLITFNPISKLKKLKEFDSKTKTRYLTEDERSRLMATLDEMDLHFRKARERTRQHAKGAALPSMDGWEFANYFKPIIILSLNTGIRRNALLSLRWEDVDLEHGNITLRADTAKSKKSAIIPLNNTAHQALKQWYAQRLDNNPLVFPSSKTGVQMKDCDKLFEKLKAKANITNFTWHDMRHDFASRLVMAGVDLNTVRELMTHSDIKMTLRYAHLAPEKKRAAVELIS